MERFSNIPALSRKQFLDTLLVLINAEVADSICGIVDGVVVSRFLGSDAIAAHGIANPIFVIMTIFISLLIAAFQQPSTVCIGRGEWKKANGMYSATILLSLLFSVLMAVGGLFFPQGIASLLGARGSATITRLSAEYLQGAFLGTPSLVMFLILIPVLQIEGKRRLVHIGSIVMCISDIIFDLVSVKILHWGMFGIGLANAVSYTLGLLVLLSYYLDKNRLFRFSIRDILCIDGKHMFLMGLPTGVRMTSLTFAVVLMNTFVMFLSGPTGMAALSVQQSLCSPLMSVLVGLSGTTLLLTGVSYGEQDRRELMDVVRMSAYYSIVLLGFLALLVFLLARPLVSLYLNPAETAFPLAVDAVRWLAVSFPLMGWSRCAGCYLQGVEKNRQALLLFFLEELVLLLGCAVVMGEIWGIRGVFASFAVSQVLVIALINILAYLQRDRKYRGMEAFLFVPDHYGVAPEDRLVRTLTSREEVWTLSEEVMNFCRERGLPQEKSYMASLYVEEMGNIIMLYGFSDGNPHKLEVRLSVYHGEIILRFRDDCRRFDIREKAAHWKEDPLHPETTLGVRMVMKACKILRYNNSLKTNNLLVIL